MHRVRLFIFPIDKIALKNSKQFMENLFFGAKSKRALVFEREKGLKRLDIAWQYRPI